MCDILIRDIVATYEADGKERDERHHFYETWRTNSIGFDPKGHKAHGNTIDLEVSTTFAEVLARAEVRTRAGKKGLTTRKPVGQLTRRGRRPGPRL